MIEVMKITNGYSSPVAKPNEVNELTYVSSSKELMHGRDMLIINPIAAGNGDKVLAQKIANIALDEGCRVTIYNIKSPSKRKIGIPHNISLRDDEPHSIDSLRDPLFIVVPVGIMSPDCLKYHMTALTYTYRFAKKDVVLIEEMDVYLTPEREPVQYEKVLREMGFENIVANRLGFSEGAIGYIPTDERMINEIKGRFENELRNLMDSYHVTLGMGEVSYYFAYISCLMYEVVSKVFVANILTETKSDNKDANFILVIRKHEDQFVEGLIDELNETLEKVSDDFDYPSLFSKVTFSVIDQDGKFTKHSTIAEGVGQRKINIFVIQSVPKNIFDDFMCLCDVGMASGDQSLSEYISLKGRLPYYDCQPFKYQMVMSLKERGGEELHQYIRQRSPMTNYNLQKSFYQLTLNRNQPNPSSELLAKQAALGKSVSSMTATTRIKELLTTGQTGNSKLVPRK